MARKNKFNKVADRVQKIKDAVGGDYVKIEEEGLYDALCVGIVYREDVESEYEGVTKVQDKVSYIFAVPVEEDEEQNIKGGVATLVKEYTVSGYEQAKILPMLKKFNLDLEEFFKLIGETVRISVDIRTSKKGNEYAMIEKITVAKKSTRGIELDEDLELPYFYADGAEEDLIDLIDGVTIAKENKKRKMKKVVDIDEEESDDDEFFDDLED